LAHANANQDFELPDLNTAHVRIAHGTAGKPCGRPSQGRFKLGRLK